jgi:hypothetical protein
VDAVDGGLKMRVPANGWFDLVERILTWVLGVLCVVVTVGIFIPVVGYDPVPDRATLSNTKQLALGALMYANDFDDRLPLAANWMDGLAKYQEWGGLYHAPDLPKANRDGYGFALRKRLAGKSLSEVIEPGKTAMIFESILLQRNAVSELWSLPDPGRAPRGTDCVAFVDGHAKDVAPEIGRKLK